MLSPTLFLVFIRDIPHRMLKNMQGAIYSDDLALWCSEEYITTADYRLQAPQVIESWARSWLVKVNEKKTTFSLQPFQPTPESALETEWTNTTSIRYTYIPRSHPGSKTNLE